MQQAIESFLQDPESTDLEDYSFSQDEWAALDVLIQILEVSFLFNFQNFIEVVILFVKVPHGFQQQLSQERVPSLCNAIPAYEAMRLELTTESTKHGTTAKLAILKGLNKFEEYYSRAEAVPAYTAAMSKWCSCFYSTTCSLKITPVLNPALKLAWIQEVFPDDYDEIKSAFIDQVSPYLTFKQLNNIIQ